MSRKEHGRRPAPFNGSPRSGPAPQRLRDDAKAEALGAPGLDGSPRRFRESLPIILADVWERNGSDQMFRRHVHEIVGGENAAFAIHYDDSMQCVHKAEHTDAARSEK